MAYRMIEQKALGTGQSIASAEPSRSAETDSLGQVFCLVCNSVFDLTPCFTVTGFLSLSGRLTTCLYHPFTLPAIQISCKQTQTIACTCMRVFASSSFAAVYIRMQKFACVCTRRGDVSNRIRCKAPPFDFMRARWVCFAWLIDAV